MVSAGAGTSGGIIKNNEEKSTLEASYGSEVLIMIFPFICERLQDHEVVKPQLLQMIEETSSHSESLGDEMISASDYSTNPREAFPQYVDLLLSSAATILHKYFFYLNLKADVANAWFHQYIEGDLFGWHSHGDSSFSLIYYLELPADGPKTQFMMPPFSSVFTAEVKEGDVLIFPAQTKHRSPVNHSTDRKTIIAMKFTIGDEYDNEAANN